MSFLPRCPLPPSEEPAVIESLTYLDHKVRSRLVELVAEGD